MKLDSNLTQVLFRSYFLDQVTINDTILFSFIIPNFIHHTKNVMQIREKRHSSSKRTQFYFVKFIIIMIHTVVQINHNNFYADVMCIVVFMMCVVLLLRCCSDFTLLCTPNLLHSVLTFFTLFSCLFLLFIKAMSC